jgi:hypothetical protein
MRTAAAVILCASLWADAGQAAQPLRWMVKLTVDGRQIEGSPLAWDGQHVFLLGRDGQLWDLPASRMSKFEKSNSSFRSYPPSELRAMLLRELGAGYEVSGTRHYMVAHPSGQRDKWAGRFEDLYRAFVHYFSVRGFELQEPPFPLIGVVCRSRRDFQRYANLQGGPPPAEIQGYYSSETNRIVLYDLGGKEDSREWQRNALVIVHEATHQTAFNTGIHSRYVPPPLWVAEGLATMFEARGVHNSRSYTSQSDRINQGRLHDFRSLVVPNHRPEMLATLVASDELFRSEGRAAYAEAWALSFYLVETQPRKYARYVALTAERPPFTLYSAAERTADFTSVFGDNWRMIEAQFLRFMRDLKSK